jgi:CRISPR-associated protein Csx3
VVVATHSRETRVGQVIPLSLSLGRSPLGMALLIVGPPDSGKSVLSHALFRALLSDSPNTFLQRAQWDGEGNWILELPEDATDADRETFKLVYKGELTEQFFPYHADAILRLRREKTLVLVDVGGKVQSEKVPILEACSHYLIISRDRQEVAKWHEFCGARGNLRPLAVIHSTLEPTASIHQREPFLEMTCGPWVQGGAIAVPPILLEQITAQLRSR